MYALCSAQGGIVSLLMELWQVKQEKAQDQMGLGI